MASKTLAELIVHVVLDDLLDRHTIGDELHIIAADSPDIYQEMVESCTKRVLAVLEGADGKDR